MSWETRMWGWVCRSLHWLQRETRSLHPQSRWHLHSHRANGESQSCHWLLHTSVTVQNQQTLACSLRQWYSYCLPALKSEHSKRKEYRIFLQIFTSIYRALTLYGNSVSGCFKRWKFIDHTFAGVGPGIRSLCIRKCQCYSTGHFVS